MKISLSICVPVFNEEKTLKGAVEDLILTLSRYVNEIEVVIVDDASTDLSGKIAEQLSGKYSQVKLIHHQKNSGIGACYRDALAIAKGEYFTWFPSDHENPAEDFIQYFKYLEKGVIVTCHHRGQDPRPFLRRLISLTYTWVLNKTFHLDLKFYNGLTMFPASLLRSLPLVTNGFAFPAESVIRAIRQGCQVLELPSPLKKRQQGKAKALTFISFSRMARDIFRLFAGRRMGN